MLVLTMKEPWASALVYGPKNIENRRWSFESYGVGWGDWVLIHAGKSWDKENAEAVVRQWLVEQPSTLPSNLRVALGLLEWPGTYEHVETAVAATCAVHGIELVIIDGNTYPVRDARTLFEWLEARKQIPIANKAMRLCTLIAKVERFEKWLDDRYPDQDVEVWVGFDAGEPERAAKDPNSGSGRKHRPGQARRHNRFPLIEAGLCRCRCEKLARSVPWPVPRKSACTFCPLASKADWKQLRAQLPLVLERVSELEDQKPETKNGYKLSIMGFRSSRLQADGTRTRGRPTPLRVYVEQPYRAPARKVCDVCREGFVATKATGCGALTPAEYCG